MEEYAVAAVAGSRGLAGRRLAELAVAGDAVAAGLGAVMVQVAGMYEAAMGAVALEDMERLAVEGARKIGRDALQLALDAQADAEAADPLPGLAGADGRWRGCREKSQVMVVTMVGKVRVRRVAYRSRERGVADLHWRDAVLNLAPCGYSWRLQRFAEQACRAGSFQDARDLVLAAAGVSIGKRQLEEILARAAGDAEAFAAGRPVPDAPAGGQERAAVLGMSADAKGVAMRPGALRGETARKAAKREKKGAHRLGSGQKQASKRMAETGAVFDSLPPDGEPRTPQDVMGRPPGQPPRTPRAVNKWYTCGITATCAGVIALVFEEADRRDPKRQRDWLALVDGNDHQIECFRKEAAARGKDITILIDFIHVIGYLWKAALAFTPPRDTRAAEDQVTAWGLRILAGESRAVVTDITARAAADPPKPGGEHENSIRKATHYLQAKEPCLGYPAALASGWPIATGLIEGACRHIIGDRLGITGARWSLPGAQAMLWLRAIAASGDTTAYWNWHITREHQRNHLSKLQNPPSPQDTLQLAA